ncbi:MAG: enoyl-CoA hydratase/isomerase family protein [Syntrophobacterales bacterium]|nr:enoyl-CoA hydratase/isomerase family protein [Syntrophobacterales bacterium]
MSEYGIRLEFTDHIAVITIDRPQRMNTFNQIMWSELERVVAKLRENLPRVIVLTGAGDKAFSAGFDVNIDNPQVSNLVEAVQKHDCSPVEKLIRRIRTAVDGLVCLPVPVIAAINGKAYGGGAELAVRCDLRVMDPDAVISFSEVRLGLMPDWGGGVSLTRLVGPSIAADLILSARRVTAEDALKIGLVNRISERGKALQDSMALAETIAGHGPRAVMHALKVIRKSPDLSLKDALDLETEEAADLIASGECYHGIMAFLSKEKPEFPNP